VQLDGILKRLSEARSPRPGTTGACSRAGEGCPGAMAASPFGHEGAVR